MSELGLTKQSYQRMPADAKPILRRQNKPIIRLQQPITDHDRRGVYLLQFSQRPILAKVQATATFVVDAFLKLMDSFTL